MSSLCAGILLFVSSSAFIACPFYRLNIRGIIAYHWCIINWFSSGTFSSQGVSDFLVATSTSLVFLEVILFSDIPQCTLSFSILSSLLLLTVDLLILLLVKTARIEIGLFILLSLSILTWTLLHSQSYSITVRERNEIDSIDMFSNPSSPIDCMGSWGIIHTMAILISVAIQIPLFSAPRLLLHSLYIIRSLCTLSMLFTPANFGGAVQALKRTGRALGSRFAQPDTVKENCNNTVTCISE